MIKYYQFLNITNFAKNVNFVNVAIIANFANIDKK